MDCRAGVEAGGGLAGPPPIAAVVNPLVSAAPMLVLLPASRGKATPIRGRRMGLTRLVYPRLAESRERLIAAVDPSLLSAPAAPAAELYTGVLYQSLGLADLPWEDVLIASALWGVVRPGDRIPAYRLDMGDKPAGIGGLAAFWRGPLAAVMRDRPGELVLDLRSAAFAATWRPHRATQLSVGGLSEAPDGSRRVITHMAKRVRGEVARLVLDAGGAATPAEVAEIATSAGLRVELSPGRLDVIE